jgi:hypothetical protein
MMSAQAIAAPVREDLQGLIAAHKTRPLQPRPSSAEAPAAFEQLNGYQNQDF